MNIAIDLSPLQGHHRMRGIGYTLLHFVNNISEEDRKSNHYVFYVIPYSEGVVNPLEVLDLRGLDYEVKDLKSGKRFTFSLPGKLKYFRSVLNQLMELKELHLGDPRVGRLKQVDVFLQCDQSQTLPRKRLGKKNALFVYDIIPYVLEWDYLWNYKTAKRRGYTWKGASLSVVRRWLYVHKIKVNVRHAHKLLAISSSTAKDFVKYLRVKPKKVSVVPLGVPEVVLHEDSKAKKLKVYQSSSWGYLPKEVQFDSEVPFLLFVGGADRRRKLADLVAAFNMLRARGVDIRLVLAGDSMQGPDTVSTEETQKAIMGSSYIKDIIFMGFTDDDTREWLYRHALAFVFPSRYEGFGLPVLEAMQYGTPVISYRNDATIEVAGKYPIYAESALDILHGVESLMQNGVSEKVKKESIKHANSYSWKTTSRKVLVELKRL